MVIGVIGQGYVGTAVKTIFSEYHKVETFDIVQKLSSCVSLEELVNKADIIFICVPTPMNRDGSCNIDSVEEIVFNISKLVINQERTIVIKSTVPPGTTKSLDENHNNISVVFNPEFLTEANFIEDFKNQNRIIIGGNESSSTKLMQIYSSIFPESTIIKTSSDIAEMVKYFTNAFLSTKVSFSNEMKLLCDKLDIDYDKIIKYSTYDDRLGKSHWSVPGPDGHFGFGGSCLPKDLNSLIDLFKKYDIESHTLNGVWKTNLEVRPEKDWEELEGRAVNEN